MKKLTTKLMISVLSVALAFIALGTSTFAWFSMNTTVEATGMQLTAVTPVNLLINTEADAVWSNTVAADESFTGKLYPSSSQAGTLFNAIMNSGNYIGGGNGGVAESTTKFQKSSAQGGTKVVAMSGSNEGYWAEYTFALKLSQAQDSDEKIYLSTLKFYEHRNYTSAELDAMSAKDKVSDGKYYTFAANAYTLVPAETALVAGSDYYYLGGIAGACRAALYTGATAGAKTTKVNIYSNADDTANAITTDVAADDTAFSTLATAATASVAATTIAKASATSTNSFEVNGDPVHVTLVVWIEGQDTDCVNAYAGHTFKIQVEFSVAQ